jgi:hypothetical protein
MYGASYAQELRQNKGNYRTRLILNPRYPEPLVGDLVDITSFWHTEQAARGLASMPNLYAFQPSKFNFN